MDPDREDDGPQTNPVSYVVGCLTLFTTLREISGLPLTMQILIGGLCAYAIHAILWGLKIPAIRSGKR